MAGEDRDKARDRPRARLGRPLEERLPARRTATRSRAPKASVRPKLLDSGRAATSSSTSAAPIRSPLAQVGASLSTSRRGRTSPRRRARQADGGLRVGARTKERELFADPALQTFLGHVPEQQLALCRCDRLRERRLLGQLPGNERQCRLGHRRTQVRTESLDVCRLPQLRLLDEHQPPLAREQADAFRPPTSSSPPSSAAECTSTASGSKRARRRLTARSIFGRSVPAIRYAACSPCAIIGKHKRAPGGDGDARRRAGRRGRARNTIGSPRFVREAANEGDFDPQARIRSAKDWPWCAPRSS